jgi:hypothetical protein
MRVDSIGIRFTARSNVPRAIDNYYPGNTDHENVCVIRRRPDNEHVVEQQQQQQQEDA